MGRSLEMLQRDVREAVTYNEDLGAKQVTVRLVSGVMKRLTVRIESDREAEDDRGLSITERLKVTICRVSEADGNTKGLVKLPAIGMKLYRDASDDPWAPEPYVWGGEIAEEWPTQWVLEFTRTHVYGDSVDA